mmetsp:Transcript_2150/g.7850  ORF Transcript_2150/g.7850 Transcript_2150/m.7850 type:complete len:80 (-) Transcript_2150:912-1151(-)
MLSIDTAWVITTMHRPSENTCTWNDFWIAKENHTMLFLCRLLKYEPTPGSDTQLNPQSPRYASSYPLLAHPPRPHQEVG